MPTPPEGPVEVMPRGASKINQSRLPRPNYARIHGRLLPVVVHPLPDFIPHNPLSLLRIAYTLLSQYLRPPVSHNIYEGYWSAETYSVHVTDPQSVQALWARGFFGKGSLSRSEPQWLEEQKRKRGFLAGETSAEVVQKRRAERREFKQDRALKEREAVEEELRRTKGAVHDGGESSERQALLMSSEAEAPNVSVVWDSSAQRDAPRTVNETSYIYENGLDEATKDVSQSNTIKIEESSAQPILNPRPRSPSRHASERFGSEQEPALLNQEHLQLSLEEAFFLSYALGVLTVRDPSMTHSHSSLPVPALFQLCRKRSYFPPASPSALRTDDPFLVSYVVYHHFRSLGWVVRPGMKFAVDFLLYHRGPAFSHAEFAVLILPSCSRTPGAPAQSKAELEKVERREWWWQFCMSRVQAQVMKTLVLVFVEVPPQVSADSQGITVEDIGALLKRYRVREFICKRWLPNRKRD